MIFLSMCGVSAISCFSVGNLSPEVETIPVSLMIKSLWNIKKSTRLHVFFFQLPNIKFLISLISSIAFVAIPFCVSGQMMVRVIN